MGSGSGRGSKSAQKYRVLFEWPLTRFYLKLGGRPASESPPTQAKQTTFRIHETSTKAKVKVQRLNQVFS